MSKPVLKVLLLVIWIIFTISLTVWWLIFGIQQLNLITAAGLQTSSDLVRSHRMLLLEGATLVVSLIGGALAFYLLAMKERRQSDAVQQFLLTFTHELKTPIASLRLQTETLAEKISDDKLKPLMERLIGDTSRLTLQLDNSLYVASIDSDRLIFENIDFKELIASLSHEWPSIEMLIDGNASLTADKRALQSILRNLIHNSVTHGKATKITISIKPGDKDSLVSIELKDNGRGFQGDPSRVAKKLFSRQYSGSGSGIGLYLVSKLSRMLGGSSKPLILESGFGYNLQIPGAIKV